MMLSDMGVDLVHKYVQMHAYIQGWAKVITVPLYAGISALTTLLFILSCVIVNLKHMWIKPVCKYLYKEKINNRIVFIMLN